MSVLVGFDTRLVVQGMGSAGAFHAKQMVEYGTKVVAGVTPGKGGSKVAGLEQVPLVVRLEGTNVELGRKILGDSGLNVVAASDMADGARRIVALAGQGQGQGQGVTP